MNGLARRVSFVLLAVSFASVAAAQESGPRYAEIPNFRRVNEHIYRGAQPAKGGMQKLAALGVKTVINLRDDDERARAEEGDAKAAGLRYFNVPFSGFRRPDDAEVERVLALIEDPANQPVFVHCKKGADRTGTIIALYRIRRDGWTADEAIREAKSCGLSWIQFRMKDYVADAYRRQQQDRGAPAPAVRKSQEHTAPANP